MGMNLVYRAGDQQHVVRFTMTDWDMLILMREKLPKAISTVLDTPDFGEEQAVPRAQLAAAVEDLVTHLDMQPTAEPYIYSFMIEYLQDNDTGQRIDIGGTYNSGSMGDIRLPGDDVSLYMISTGLNTCELRRLDDQPLENSKYPAVTDLRDQKEIQTITVGLVRFRKRKPRSKLISELRDIQTFLAGVDTDDIFKLIG